MSTLDKKYFNFDKLYTAAEICEVFELPVFVTRTSYSGDFKYKITSVSDVVHGEDFRGGRRIGFTRTYMLTTKFRVYPKQKLIFRDDSQKTMPDFPVIIMATVSSGKSTLVNSLLGKSILPSRNSACTAKPCYIYDNDDPKKTTVEIKKHGAVLTYSEGLAEALDIANSAPDTETIRIESQIKGAVNAKRRLLLIDTPGTNNSLDGSHERITLETLDTVGEALIVYVINAEQLGINDDKHLLLRVAAAIKKNPALKIAFVINKADSLDTEKGESIEDFILEVRKYVSDECGIKNPDIITTSALAALLFRRALAGEELTRLERNKLREFMMLYKPDGLDLASYALTEGGEDVFGEIKLERDTYKRRDVISALERTGVPFLERYIQNAKTKSEEYQNRVGEQK